MIALGKTYISKRLQEKRNPQRLPTTDDLKALWGRIEAQATRAQGQIALIADDRERVSMVLVLETLRLKQEQLAIEIDNRLARDERLKGEPVGDFQRIGAVLQNLTIPER